MSGIKIISASDSITEPASHSATEIIANPRVSSRTLLGTTDNGSQTAMNNDFPKRNKKSRSPIPLRFRSVLLLILAALAGLLAFIWPLLIPPSGVEQYSAQAPFLFGAILPVIAVLVLVDLTSDHIDAKALALLGVLTAIGAILRPLSAGTAGIDLVFFLVVLGGRVFGPAFGFIQGVLTLFTSALLVAAVGPWLPYQMIATGFVGLFAGLLPGAIRKPIRGKSEIILLCIYGAIISMVYGLFMDFAFWPYATGIYGDLSWNPAASKLHNLHVFLLFKVATALGWDLGRAITTATLIAILGPGVLRVLRRANRKAFFVPE